MVKHMIRIRAVLPSRHEVALEVDPNITVKDLKKIICSKAAALRLDEFRVLQKGLELHDQGTLEYYRVFDGTKVDIVRKHVGAIGAISPRQAADAHQDDAHKLSRGPSRDANGGGPMERPRSAAGQPPAARRPNSADPLRPRREAPAANAPMRNLDAAAASRPLRSVDGNHQGGKANPSSSNTHRYPPPLAGQVVTPELGRWRRCHGPPPRQTCGTHRGATKATTTS
jgi:hypothetical protein